MYGGNPYTALLSACEVGSWVKDIVWVKLRRQ
jgi:hypothetical protein